MNISYSVLFQSTSIKQLVTEGEVITSSYSLSRKRRGEYELVITEPYKIPGECYEFKPSILWLFHFTPLFTSCCKHELRKRQSKFL